MPRLPFLLALATVAACSSGNVKSAKDDTAPAAPPVRNPIYNPYAAYGEANATWQPPVFNRDGTVVKPAEPASQFDRPPYETAPWATGADGGSRFAPPGTF
jgi:hypothetical protein